MERKVIQLAGKTLVVSLPSKWAKKYSIKKGDTIFVEESERSIIIKTKKDIEIEKVETELKGSPEFIKRTIDIAYKKGVDELKLRFEDSSTKKIIRNVLDSTMGFEIISQEEKTCTIKSVAKAVEEEFDNIFRRAFLTLLSMAEESYDAVSKSELERLEEISSSDKTINKLTNFCKRILNKKGKGKDTNYVYCIVWELERIGDEYRDICKKILGKKIKIKDDTSKIYKRTNEFVREFYNLFYKFDEEKGINFTEKNKKLKEDINSLMVKKKGDETVVLHHLSNIRTAVYDIAGPYYAMQI